MQVKAALSIFLSLCSDSTKKTEVCEETRVLSHLQIVVEMNDICWWLSLAPVSYMPWIGRAEGLQRSLLRINHIFL